MKTKLIILTLSLCFNLYLHPMEEPEETIDNADKTSQEKETEEPKKSSPRSLKNLAAFAFASVMDANIIKTMIASGSIPRELAECIFLNSELRSISTNGNDISNEKLNFLFGLSEDSSQYMNRESEKLLLYLYNKILKLSLPIISSLIMKQLFSIRTSREPDDGDIELADFKFYILLHRTINDYLMNEFDDAQQLKEIDNNNESLQKLQEFISVYKIDAGRAIQKMSYIQSSMKQENFWFTLSPIMIANYLYPKLVRFIAEIATQISFTGTQNILIDFLLKYPHDIKTALLLLEKGAPLDPWDEEKLNGPLRWALTNHNDESNSTIANLIIERFKTYKHVTVDIDLISNILDPNSSKQSVKNIKRLNIPYGLTISPVAQTGHFDMAKKIIEKHHSAISPAQMQAALMHTICGGRNRLKMIKLLLETWISISNDHTLSDIINNNYNCILFLQVLFLTQVDETTKSSLLDICFLLSENQYFKQYSTNSTNACGQLFNHFLETLKKAKEEPSSEILKIAIEHNYHPIIKLLVDQGISINQ